MSPLIKTISILLLTIVLIISGCVRTSTHEENVIRIGYLPITHAAPLYFEKEFEDEYLNGARIELVRFGSWIELMDALNTGRIDGASVLMELAMKAHEKGIDLKAVALGHRDGNAVVVGHHINSVQDLSGETVAIPHTLSAHNILLDEMLQNAGINYEDVNVVEMPPPEMPSALSEGRISSYVVAEPFGALGVTLNTGRVLFQSEEIRANSLCCVLVLRSDFMERDPDLTELFVNGYIEAGKKAHDYHVHVNNVNELETENGPFTLSLEEIKETHLNYLTIPEEVLALSLSWISYDDLQIREEDYEYLRQRVVEMGLSDNPPAYEDFVDQSFFEKRGESY
ncbi:ABC transporter substrate-binding protein [Evansella sp. AB-P1]|uniref:ABC transporter substrate-binding protein n=1 Tax=Evansella sp. AB-P1 TaxID=3037653 RepID=UPI00241C1E0E|nr:ABC transporter substrate-binding protein [Evansella sp. AB-P1]MDG5788552.1 ABC transporter substrate-binding protein [Evansella sp. AB-P1]